MSLTQTPGREVSQYVADGAHGITLDFVAVHGGVGGGRQHGGQEEVGELVHERCVLLVPGKHVYFIQVNTCISYWYTHVYFILVNYEDVFHTGQYVYFIYVSIYVFLMRFLCM